MKLNRHSFKLPFLSGTEVEDVNTIFIDVTVLGLTNNVFRVNKNDRYVDFPPWYYKIINDIDRISNIINCSYIFILWNPFRKY